MALSIDQIPIPVPSSTDPTNFSARGDAVFGALPNFITQTNAVASEAAANRDSAEASKVAAAISETNAATYAANATTSANNASSSSTAPLWVSGTTYAVNDKRVSPITGQVYRRKVAGAGTTDPSLDSTNWYAVLLDADTQYPTINPSLNLDFANAGKLDPRITFTRASTATYFDKLGVLRTAAINEPRFDYNPDTLEAKGLLIEESRTNLLTYSEQFDNANWDKLSGSVSVVANAVTGPDGNLNGDKVVPSSSLGVHLVRQTSVASSGACLSVYAKAGGYSFLVMSGITGVAYFNLSNGTIGTVSAPLSGAMIQSVGNGWYRCSVNMGTQGASGFNLNVTQVNGSPSFVGDGTSGIYIWGAQLEQGSFPTSYIPTTSSPVTRQADSAVMTGTNFSSWYNSSEGSIYSESDSSNTTGSPCICSITDGTVNERIELSNSASSHIVVQDSTVQVNLDAGGFTKNLFSKLAAAYKLNDFAISLDSGTVVTDSSGTLPTVNQFRIGARYDGSGNILNGHIKKIAYYPRRVPNYQLQILTK